MINCADKESNNYYNKNLQANAKFLRKDMTKAEACLWKYALRARKLSGYAFNRQRPVLNYIADFICKELRLIIEVDGLTHHFNEYQLKDIYRQQELEKHGFIVLRFTDNEVLDDLKHVVRVIEAAIDNIQNPPPYPLQEGDSMTVDL